MCDTKSVDLQRWSNLSECCTTSLTSQRIPVTATLCANTLYGCRRLPRVDYLSGDGAQLESLTYGTNPSLSYVPMYGSAQNPAGQFPALECPVLL